MSRADEIFIQNCKDILTNGVWDTDPMTGTAARMLPQIEGFHFDSHSDAAYCSALGKYMLLSQGDCRLYMLLSDDCVHWEDPIVVATGSPRTGYFSYSTIVGLDDEASTDFSTVGHDFYIYFTHKPNGEQIDGYDYDLYHRCRITID